MAVIRTNIIIVLVLICAALFACAVVSWRSKKALSREVTMLLIMLMPPVIGNSIIIASSDWLVSNVGMYLYYIGMDAIVLALLRFTGRYCGIDLQKHKQIWVAITLVTVDVVQILTNPILGFTFTTNEIIVGGAPYFALVPLAGQSFHRIVAYGIFFASLLVFVYKCITSSRVYMERYGVILASMILAGAWQSFYIFSGTPVDRSMIGFGVFGLLVFYFALYYKPFRVLDRMLSRIVSAMPAAVFFFETNGSCIYANERARRFLGARQTGEPPADAQTRLSALLGDWDRGQESEDTDMRCVAQDDGNHYYELQTQQVSDDRGRHIGTALSVRDVTESEKKLQRERHLATHDALTGVYNQLRLYEATRELIDAHPTVRFLIGGVDVKDFKIINDIFSKEYGDSVLCAIADTMRGYWIENAAFGRLSGDKFGFIMPADKFDAQEMEEGLRNFKMSEEETQHPIVLHMGTYEVIEPDLAPSVMYDRAFMAISSIKHDFNRRVVAYDNEMRAELIWTQSISSQLENAIATGQIQPYLQPMVDPSGKIEGAEVLVRWIHPEEGFLSPARFIPVFEENGMIAQLDLHMWECACRILREWKDRGIDLFLSVNISPKDFYFIDVFGTIRNLVEQYGIDPHKLRLEITETVMMTDLENRLRIIEDLRAYGFLVEMDDFGSGYSSLNMLKDIPVDILKIDMMFLYKTKDQVKARTILQTIINLSGQLGIPSITEGVETVEQLEMLVGMGCRLFQGYYFAKPMPRSEFEALVGI